MKKSIVYATICAVALMFSSCGGTQQIAKKSANPFAEAFEAPCQVYDTDTEFAATGKYRGSSKQLGECELNALQNARQMVYEKFHHKYSGKVRNYSNSYGSNNGNDIATKLQRGGDQALEVVLNDVKSVCVKWSPVEDDGHITCYNAIRVSKQQLAQETAKAIDNILTKEEKRMIDFQEDKFFKELEKEWAEFEK